MNRPVDAFCMGSLLKWYRMVMRSTLMRRHGERGG